MGIGSALIVLLAVPAQPAPSACPVTLVEHVKPFAEPSPSNATKFWYGSEDLAVRLSADGRWHGMGPAQRYRNKLFWWRKGFNGTSETRPALVAHGRRLDGPAPPVEVSSATNAHHADFGGWAMLDMPEFPTAGCWELIGDYHGKKLRFVVLVGV